MLARIGPAWARRRSRPSERCALKDHMPARRHGERLPMAFLDLGVGDGWDHRSQQVAGCSPRRLYRPCRARPADRSLAAEDRSAGGVRDRAGPEPAGTRWVHAEPAGRGVQRARAVTSGGEEPQVKPPAQPRPATPSGGGPEFGSPHPNCREASGPLPTRQVGHRGRASPASRVGTVAAGCEPWSSLPAELARFAVAQLLPEVLQPDEGRDIRAGHIRFSHPLCPFLL